MPNRFKPDLPMTAASETDVSISTISQDNSFARAYEVARTLAAMGLLEEATRALRSLVASAPDRGAAWLELSVLLRVAGNDAEADIANSRAGNASCHWLQARDDRTPAELEAAERVLRERLSGLSAPVETIELLQSHLREHETDVAAMRLLARAERGRGNLFTARHLFERALDLAPHYYGAREDLALVLGVLGEHAHALEQTRCLISHEPANTAYRVLHADALRNVGDLDAAIPIIEQVIEEKNTRAHLRCIHARMLHFTGRRDESAREFRAVLGMRPKMGEAWWGLSELRGDFFTSDDVTSIREHLCDSGVDDNSRMLMQLALGRALENLGDFAGSFDAYEAGAALARLQLGEDDYDPARNSREIGRRRSVFTARLLERCANPQDSSPGPIFIVGMPRAGSTLVEQILSSHSLVEGTMELPVIGHITRELSNSRPLVAPDAYPECVANLTPMQLAELGARYSREAAYYRRTDRPFFIDKCPWNWLEAALIRMILPQAKIIDVRREPMAACFAMYKQELSDSGLPRDFEGLASYYMEYVRLMKHYQQVMPGHIHLVRYEQLVEDSEGEIRRLLDYCGLPFEKDCLRFWETRRTVATPSAEQVRRPIFRDALKQWRNFEPWLGPLKLALQAAETATTAEDEPESYDRALTFAAMSVYEDAIEELQAVTRRSPTHPGAWKKLSELLRLAGRDKAADEAEARANRYAGEASNWRSSRDLRTPEQLEAGKRALETPLASSERNSQMAALRKHLAEIPTDAAAMHLLSDLEALDTDEFTSIALLERTLELSPSWDAARHAIIARLANERQLARALEHVGMLVQKAPDLEGALQADILERSGRISEATALMEDLLRRHPRRAGFWLKYAMFLRDAGRREESARAFRTSLEIMPKLGDAYAGLADLKGDVLNEADARAIRTCLADPSLDPAHRMRMHYALGHFLERTRDYSGSFASYQSAARLIRGAFLGRGEAYDEKRTVERVRRYKGFFTARILSRSPAPTAGIARVTPIFVVGMPRAGSTLVEQILASHSQVEGTRELSLIGEIVRELAIGRRVANPNAYPECLLDMTAGQLAALGERYIERASELRQTELPYFVDKRPWNWLDAGLIRMILPQARIVDIRREPMAACFAMYKQQLPKDAAFSYDLEELGHYYNLYVSLMEHWKSVMPGWIHFVQYERLVEDTESEIRRMLDYCGLTFEEGCLRFWETDRAVLTPSAEQVRRPIYRDAVGQWRNFEPWLGPLKAALSEPPRA